MSKERLEEIKQYLIHFYNAVDVEEDIKVYIFNTLKIEWLIEQAERVQKLEEIKSDAIRQIDVTQRRNERLEKRVQELEEDSKDAKFAIDMLQAENQRYKQALEDIRRILDLYPHVDYSKSVTRRRLFDLANEALEGEE